MYFLPRQVSWFSSTRETRANREVWWRRFEEKKKKNNGKKNWIFFVCIREHLKWQNVKNTAKICEQSKNSLDKKTQDAKLVTHWEFPLIKKVSFHILKKIHVSLLSRYGNSLINIEVTRTFLITFCFCARTFSPSQKVKVARLSAPHAEENEVTKT